MIQLTNYEGASKNILLPDLPLRSLHSWQVWNIHEPHLASILSLSIPVPFVLYPSTLLSSRPLLDNSSSELFCFSRARPHTRKILSGVWLALKSPLEFFHLITARMERLWKTSRRNEEIRMQYSVVINLSLDSLGLKIIYSKEILSSCVGNCSHLWRGKRELL